MTLNKILQWSIWGGLFLVLFLPLYVSESMFFPFISGKNFAFRIITELILGAWVILALRDAAYRPKKSLILYGAGALLLVMAIATVLSENPFKSFWSNYERMEGFVGLLHVFAYFVVLGSVLARGNLWERFWQTSLGVNAILLGYGVLQLAGKLTINQGGVRVDATFGNTTYFAVYLLFHIFIAAFLAVRHKGASWIRWAYGAIILADIFMLYHTATRGAILGLLGGVMLTTALIALLERNNAMLRKSAIGVLVAAILIPATIFMFRDAAWVKESPVLARFTSISLEETTTKSRFMVWNMAWQGFKERPVLGWGQESFNYVFNKYYDPKMYDQEPWFDRAHNVFFDWLIAGGILALLAYLSLFGFTLYYLWCLPAGQAGGSAALFSITEKSILTGLLGGYFFQNIFVFDNLVSYLLFFSVLAYLHSAVATKELFPQKGNAAWNTNVIFPPIVIVVTVFALYFFNYQPIAANKDLIRALQQQESLDINLSYFKKSIARETLGMAEAREQLAMASSRILSLNVDQGIKGQFVSTATEELKNQIARTPGDARHQIFLGSFLNQIGDYDQALTYLGKAAELTPKKQQVYFEIASAYLNKKDYANAVSSAKIAFELEPAYDTARLVYAMTLVYAKDKTTANEILAPLREKNNGMIPPDERLLRAYIDTKDYKGAEEVINALIAKDPQNPQYLISLAALYLERGERQKAITQIEKAITINPEFKQQGEYYINEIKAGRNP